MTLYFVYIITNQRNTVLYTGVSNNLEQRIFDHKTKRNHGFTFKYHCNKMVYYEEFADIDAAISREKQLKKYRRAWKEDLITQINPEWKDLTEGWYHPKSIELGLQLNKHK